MRGHKHTGQVQSDRRAGGQASIAESNTILTGDAWNDETKKSDRGDRKWLQIVQIDGFDTFQ